MNTNYGDWYLDLSTIKDLTKDEQDNIHSYYRDMLNYEFEKRNTISQSYFHTLQKSGYIKNATQENRDEKLGKLING
jgi:hypothetical protein